MLIKTLITAVLLIVALASNGAGPAAAHGLARQDPGLIPSPPTTDPSGCVVAQPGQELREEFHQTYPLSATGRVSLQNINGGVQIKVWDRAAVQVDALKKAYKPHRLTEAQIQVNSTEESISIRTEYPDQNQNFRNDERRYDNPAIVEYTLTVPRKAMLSSVELVNGSLDIEGVEGSVKASSINGRVNARGLAGDARLSTVNGELQATFTQLDESKPINLASVNGSVTLIIPSNANASIRAGTVHGSISSDFGLKVKHGEYVGHSMDGQIGTGGPRIKLGNVNGQIRVTHAQDGLPLSPAMSAAGEVKVVSDVDVDVDVEISAAVEAAERTRVRVESARVAREAQREAQRQVNKALIDAQREVQRAQRQLMLEQARAERAAVSARGKGTGEGWGRGEGSGAKFTSQETRTFTVSGSPRVTITTFDGQVKIHGWDKSEVSYTATKHAHDEETLKQISIQAQQQGQAISVNAVNDNQHNGSVHLDVYVPRQSTLHVSSGDGALNLDGVNGQITLRSGDGPIEVANGGGQLIVNTGDGVIRVIKFDGQVEAHTGDGAIDLDGNFNAVAARTGDGTISLTVPAGSSFTIETNSPEEISNEGFIVAEDITPSPRFKRWRIGNGGKVFVLKTGDGKILLRPQK
jgi:DUF4097 and DUF4098 domain-containing protein YvlB